MVDDNAINEANEATKDLEELARPEGLALEILQELKDQNNRIHETNKKLISAIKVSFVVTGILVIAFLVYLCMFDTVVIDSGGGYASYIGNDGDVNNYGENSGQTEKDRETKESNGKN